MEESFIFFLDTCSLSSCRRSKGREGFQIFVCKKACKACALSSSSSSSSSSPSSSSFDTFGDDVRHAKMWFYLKVVFLYNLRRI
jgi:hypothetical protein